MDLRIGFVDTPKELEVELPDDADAEDVRGQLSAAAAGPAMVWLLDRKGQLVGINGARLAYAVVGSARADRRVGFGVG